MGYLSNISIAVRTTWKGMFLSIQYFFQARKKRKKEWVAEENYFEKSNGTFTVQYPHEEIPIPDNGRYQLHNEIDDCIVCDKCAKICPVDCIDIEPVRSPEVYGKTSDGTPLRIHAAKFDIDMAKCCFCGLCTVVCPTECLTMTKEFDFSTTDILDHNFSFSKMTENEIADKKKDFEDFQAAKTKPQTAMPTIKKEEIATSKSSTKPVFRPKVKPVLKPKTGDVSENLKKSASKPTTKPKSGTTTPKKPVIRPNTAPKSDVPKNDSMDETPNERKKPIIKPRIPRKK